MSSIIREPFVLGLGRKFLTQIIVPDAIMAQVFRAIPPTQCRMTGIPRQRLSRVIRYRILDRMSTGPESKPLFWLTDGIKTPPFSIDARREAGELLRLIQDGESPGMPRSRPMPSIGPRVHELRIVDETRSWRIMYRIDSDLILVVAIVEKRTERTPKRVIDLCKKRLKAFDA